MFARQPIWVFMFFYAIIWFRLSTAFYLKEEKYKKRLNEYEEVKIITDPLKVRLLMSQPSKEEIKFTPVVIPNRFSQYDSIIPDGHISLKELIKTTGAEQNAKKAFQAADEDADGEISPEEFKKAPWSMKPTSTDSKDYNNKYYISEEKRLQNTSLVARVDEETGVDRVDNDDRMVNKGWNEEEGEKEEEELREEEEEEHGGEGGSEDREKYEEGGEGNLLLKVNETSYEFELREEGGVNGERRGGGAFELGEEESEEEEEELGGGGGQEEEEEEGELVEEKGRGAVKEKVDEEEEEVEEEKDKEEKDEEKIDEEKIEEEEEEKKKEKKKEKKEEKIEDFIDIETSEKDLKASLSEKMTHKFDLGFQNKTHTGKRISEDDDSTDEEDSGSNGWIDQEEMSGESEEDSGQNSVEKEQNSSG